MSPIFSYCKRAAILFRCRSGQLIPNGWRYFLATFLLCPTVFPGQLMSVPEFLNIYGPHFYRATESGTFMVRGKNQFIELGSTYSNNKHWSEQFFYILGEWEASSSEALPLKHTVPREWGATQENCKYLCLFPFLLSRFGFLYF